MGVVTASIVPLIAHSMVLVNLQADRPGRAAHERQRCLPGRLVLVRQGAATQLMATPPLGRAVRQKSSTAPVVHRTPNSHGLTVSTTSPDERPLPANTADAASSELSCPLPPLSTVSHRPPSFPKQLSCLQLRRKHPLVQASATSRTRKPRRTLRPIGVSPETNLDRGTKRPPARRSAA